MTIATTVAISASKHLHSFFLQYDRMVLKKAFTETGSIYDIKTLESITYNMNASN